MPIDPFTPRSFLYSKSGVVIAKAAPYSTAMDWLLAIADRLKPKIRATFLAAVEAARKEIPMAQIEALAAQGRYQEILAILRTEQRMDDLLKGSFVNAISQAMVAAGTSAGPRIPRAMLRSPTVTVELEGLFNLVNPRVTRFLNNYAAGLVTNISHETGRTISSLLGRANEEGLTPKAVARQLRDVVGLRPDQEASLASYRQRLEMSGTLKPDQLTKAVERYAARLLRERTELIARTESMRAANAGQQLAWDEAASRQLLAPDTKRRWLVTKDDRLCPFCAAIPALNPDGVGFSEAFQTKSGQVLAPPLHPNCRCAMSLIIAAPPPL